MENNILGGLVIFVVVVTCLLLLDDISSPQELNVVHKKSEVEQVNAQTDLAIVNLNE